MSNWNVLENLIPFNIIKTLFKQELKTLEI